MSNENTPPEPSTSATSSGEVIGCSVSLAERKCPNCGSMAGDDEARTHYECGSYSYKNTGHKTLHYESDECTYRGAARDAWQIINVLNMSEMDKGESYPKALEWLKQWEHLKPSNLS